MNKGALLGMFALLGACAARPLPEPTAAAVLAARAAVPNATLETLQQGRTIAMLECSECHAPPQPRHKPFERWPGTIERMGERAEIDEREKTLVLEYMQVMRLAPKPEKTEPPPAP